MNTSERQIKLSETHLDINDTALGKVFDDIQGNILKSHGRAHSRHIFLKCIADTEDHKKWLGSLASQLTSALEQHHTAVDFKQTGKEHLYTGLMLSYSGYKALGVKDTEIPDDKAFRAGMKNVTFRYDTGPEGVHKRTINPLNDNPKDWDPPFQEQIDVLLILAYGGAQTDSKACEDYLDKEVQKIEEKSKGIAQILNVQNGYTLRNQNGAVIEHFGFVDGLSNPVFFKSDFDRWNQQEGIDHYDPSASFGLVAVNDPGGKDLDASFGSYFVYRKMQQNIKGFIDQSTVLASLLSDAIGHPIQPEYSSALAFGRFKDGTPLSTTVNHTPAPTQQNNFNYDQDKFGLTCPFHSHIRKTNPRGDTHRKNNTPLWNERSHRIVRRGISYGSTDLNPNEEWTDAGLLFLSCQSDIEQQFLVMQCGWSDNANFLNENTGHDPITGDQNLKTDENNKPWKITVQGKTITTDFRYQNLVRIRGGEYFFAPSISFCKKFNINNS